MGRGSCIPPMMACRHCVGPVSRCPTFFGRGSCIPPRRLLYTARVLYPSVDDAVLATLRRCGHALSAVLSTGNRSRACDTAVSSNALSAVLSTGDHSRVSMRRLRHFRRCGHALSVVLSTGNRSRASMKLRSGAWVLYPPLIGPVLLTAVVAPLLFDRDIVVRFS